MSSGAVTLVAACALSLTNAAWAQSPDTPACREIAGDAFDAEPMMGMVFGGVYMKIGEGFEASCAEQDRHRGCLTWRITGRSLLQSNETPQRFLEIPAGVVARVTTQPTFLCDAGS